MRTVRPLVWGRVSAFLADPATHQGLGAKGACCEQPRLLGHRSGREGWLQVGGSRAPARRTEFSEKRAHEVSAGALPSCKAEPGA